MSLADKHQLQQVEGLSGLTLNTGTMEQVEAARAAMQRAGLEVPDHIVMLLEVIGHETEKAQNKNNELAGLISSRFLKQTLLLAGSDFELHIFPKGGKNSPEALANKQKAEEALDVIALRKLKEEFHDVKNIDRLEAGTVKRFMAAYRHMRPGDAHNARAFEVLQQLRKEEGTLSGLGHPGLSSEQHQLLDKLCDNFSANGERTEQICGNLIYPGALVLDRVFDEQKASGEQILQPDWEPGKRQETVSHKVVKEDPEMASYGRFEVAVDHEDTPPLVMIAKYYNAMAHIREAAEAIGREQDIHFEPPERVTDHLHLSDSKDMTLDSASTLQKASGIVNVTEAMAAALTSPSSFGGNGPGRDNAIRVNKIGYASDNRSALQGQRAFSLRGVSNDELGKSNHGHFEMRLGDPRNAFNIVYMATAAVGGLNLSERLPREAVEHTSELFDSKLPQQVLDDMDLNASLAALVQDERLDFIPPATRRKILDARLATLTPEQSAGWEAHASGSMGPQHMHENDMVVTAGEYGLTPGSIVSVKALGEGSKVLGGDIILVGNEPLSRKSLNILESGEHYPTVIAVPDSRREGIYNQLVEAQAAGQDTVEAVAKIVSEEKGRVTIYPRSPQAIAQFQQALDSGQLRDHSLSFPGTRKD